MQLARTPLSRWEQFREKTPRDKAAALIANVRGMFRGGETLRYVFSGGRQLPPDDRGQPYNDRLMYNEAAQYNIRTEIARLKAEVRTAMPENPMLAGYKVFSQVDEDGIIREILNRLPSDTLSHTAIEIGCGNGLENNTHLLLLNGFRVCWLDGSPDNIDFIRRELGLFGERKGPLMVIQDFVTSDNIRDVLDTFCDFLGTKEPDLFSLDIDGNDLHVLTQAIGVINPKIVCVEYNGKFPPPLNLTVRYNAAHQWSGDDYQGASLQAFAELLTGYFLACCNISGANAFFVRREFQPFIHAYPVTDLFQPLRTHLRLLNSGHRPSLKWARDALDLAANRVTGVAPSP